MVQIIFVDLHFSNFMLFELYLSMVGLFKGRQGWQAFHLL